ncbi:MAG: transposase [Planctomycetes bacterium]|nr:transposase [Planctomycetota bacterium]
MTVSKSSACSARCVLSGLRLARDRGDLGREQGKLLFRLSRPFADGSQALRFEPSAFLERLIALVPRPGRPMLTYHGILAPAASWRDHVVPDSPPPRTSRCKSSHQTTASATKSSTHPEPPTRRHERLSWADLLRRTYAFDVLACEECGARRKMIAFLTAPDSIRRILEHLGLPTH